MAKARKYTDAKLAAAVLDSYSYRQVMLKIGLKDTGGNHAALKQRIKDLNLDTSHFTGQSWARGKSHGHKRRTEEYLSNAFPIHSHALKLRLIDEKYFQQKCYGCGLVEWRGKPIPLELEHINGVHGDNTLSNLTLLCPNCHAQTSTYCRKNRKNFVKTPLPIGPRG